MKPADQAALVEASLENAKILPRIPAGENVTLDLMSFYFFSSEAADACYEADIRSDACRDACARIRSGGSKGMNAHECDICIIGAISAAMLAEKLSEKQPNLKITIVEAGKRLFDVENRMSYRERWARYAENPWRGDFIPADMAAEGIISRTMAVGGSAMHWGGACNRFSEEDLRLHSMYGLAVDWPLEWKETGKVTPARPRGAWVSRASRVRFLRMRVRNRIR